MIEWRRVDGYEIPVVDLRSWWTDVEQEAEARMARAASIAGGPQTDFRLQSQEMSQKEIEMLGVMGELALAVLCRWSPEPVFRRDRDHGVDFTTPNGQTVQVKCTRKFYADKQTFYTAQHTPLKTDIGVTAARIEEKACAPAGFIPRADFERHSAVRSLSARPGQPEVNLVKLPAMIPISAFYFSYARCEACAGWPAPYGIKGARGARLCADHYKEARDPL